MVDRVADPAAGAISTFSGTTRDHHNGKKVLRLEYEGYIPMAERELKKICSQARERWELVKVAVAHKLGVTAVGEASVIIAVSSVHRKDSLEAVHYIIDTLKATVPVWKLEVYEGDSRVWKENAEWNGSGCCRKMVPVEEEVSTGYEGGNVGGGGEGCKSEGKGHHGDHHGHSHTSGK
ncbi:unnamed protein product [Choristocarpus tenellus]